jgi:hypothetical protein
VHEYRLGLELASWQSHETITPADAGSGFLICSKMLDNVYFDRLCGGVVLSEICALLMSLRWTEMERMGSLDMVYDA